MSQPSALPRATPRRITLYTAQERFWHWTQAALILALMVTGVVLHAPGPFGGAAFAAAVGAHELLGFALAVHAGLGLFYFVTTGRIRHYSLDRGLRQGLARQIQYYASGIFRGLAHPFVPSPRRRLNLLQRISYLLLLNVMLPAQILSGLALAFSTELAALPALGALAAGAGGLPLLAALHTLVAWLFASFLIVHLYLATTGHTVGEHFATITHGEAELPAATAPSEAEEPPR